MRRADADADDRRFGNRRVDDAHLAELVVQSLRDAERTAVGADVLAEHEHFRIAAHLFDERFADRFQVGQLLAHVISLSVTKAPSAGSLRDRGL